MAFSRSLTALTVLLAALSVSADVVMRGVLEDAPADGLVPRQRRCLNPAFVPICPGALPCAPPGAICCPPYNYVLPPGTCRAGSTPFTPSVSLPAVTSTITPAPVSTLPPTVNYIWYTRYITYTYWTYYYYYFAASWTITSSAAYFSTTISFTATNEAQATSIYASYSSALSTAIPTQTVTPSLSPSATAPTLLPTPTNGTVPVVPSSPPQFTGGASMLHTGPSFFSNVVVMAMAALVIGPGALMFLL